MKKVLFLAIVTILVTHTHTAYAFSYSRSPSGTEITSPVSFTFDITDTEWGNGINTATHPYVCLLIYETGGGVVATTDFLEWSGGEVSGTVSATIPTETEITLVAGQSMPDNVTCDASGVATAQEFEDGFDSTIFTIITGSTNATWGSNNGFWGDTTPTEIIGDMTAGVQNTGAQIWPLFAFVGVALAFGIAGLVVMNIKTQVKPSRKEIINPKGEEFIYHSAEDLEFMREYGQDKPRKRGRPRKKPL